jgi:hypothetical protein
MLYGEAIPYRATSPSLVFPRWGSSQFPLEGLLCALLLHHSLPLLEEIETLTFPRRDGELVSFDTPWDGTVVSFDTLIWSF